MNKFYKNGQFYTALEMQRAALGPLNVMARCSKDFYNNSMNPFAYVPFGRKIAATCEMIERMTRIYSKPNFNIFDTYMDGQKVDVEYKIVERMTFGRLLHFKKIFPNGKHKKQKKLLIVAPMSGHYATLLRGTVEGFLPHFDVYITDWQNAQDVPASKGTFDLDDYINYVITFIKSLGEGVNILAVCQPSVPVLAAVSIMSSEKSNCIPPTMSLIGGPIDTRNNPTEVNKLAEEKSIEWFKDTVISRVPANYPGFMRPVYPGFMQLTGFMTMNLDKHTQAHKDLFGSLVAGDGDSAEKTKKFYNEYLSVMDIPVEFYLQTVRDVFQKHSLPKGKMVSRGRPVVPSDITKTALLTIEGEKDDITGNDQTKAAISLCSGLPDNKKKHHLQKGVGHYGLFNGSKFNKFIVPLICDFINKHQ